MYVYRYNTYILLVYIYAYIVCRHYQKNMWWQHALLQYVYIVCIKYFRRTKVYASWGRYQPISNSLVSSGSNYEAHFTWPVRDGQISPCFKLIRVLTVSEEETRPPEKTTSDQWRILGGRVSHLVMLNKHNFHPASESVRRCSIDENCAANLLQADMQCVI